MADYSSKLKVAREVLEQIKYHLKIGSITYDEAKERAEPHLDMMNAYMRRRAKDFGVTFKPINFTSFMR